MAVLTSVLSRIPATFGTLQNPPAPTPGNGWEFRALSAADYNTVLAVMPRINSWTIAKLLNDKGSGSITVKADDPIFLTTLGDGSPGTNLVDTECLYQCFLNGNLIFDFLNETVQEQLVDPTEEILTSLTGPGTSQVLTWALAMPPGFPNVVFKTDSIIDDFSETDVNGNPLIDTSIWNLCQPVDGSGVPTQVTLSPVGNSTGLSFSGANPFGAVVGTCQLNATPGTTLLGGGPYDITNSVISAQITPMTAGPPLNGSQVTQLYVQSTANGSWYAMIALSGTQFYAQLGDTTGVKTKTLSAYDPNADSFWMITEQNGYFFFWASSDGANWTQLWTVPHHFSASRINVFFAATYSAPNVASVGVTAVNANVTVPTKTGNIFLNQPVLAIWRSLLADAKARGTIPFLTTRLSAAADSFGNPYTDTQSAQIANGTDLYALLQSVASIVNADFRMQPGFNLQVGLPLSFSGQISIGVDRSQQIIFHESDQVVTKSRTRARDVIQNLIGAVNQDGTIVTAKNTSSITAWQQREGWITTGQQITQEGMAIVAAASVQQTSTENLSWTLTVRPDKPGCVPLQDFDVGDWIGMERPGIGASIIDAVRVIGIAYSGDADGLITCELTLVGYRQWLDQQLQYLVNKFGGQFISALGTSLLTSVPVQPAGLPFVISQTLGGLSNVTID